MTAAGTGETGETDRGSSAGGSGATGASVTLVDGDADGAVSVADVLAGATGGCVESGALSFEGVGPFAGDIAEDGEDWVVGCSGDASDGTGAAGGGRVEFVSEGAVGAKPCVSSDMWVS